MKTMDTDGDKVDVDQQLLQQFRCMGTTDKDELVKQLKMLVGNIPTATAKFLLEMNDWNLQAAVGSYFDIEAPRKVYSMSLVRDETASSVYKLPPNTTLRVEWLLLNNGDDPWPEGCCLQFTGGDALSDIKSISVPRVPPNEFTAISATFYSPPTPGVYKSEWRMVTSAGAYFGDIIWVLITVEDGPSILAKQLSDLNTSPGSSSTSFPSSSNFPNPFSYHQ